MAQNTGGGSHCLVLLGFMHPGNFIQNLIPQDEYQFPPRLLEPAGQTLLGKEDLVISGLEKLPKEIFSPLVMKVFSGTCRETLQVMVQAWPSACLLPKVLMKMSHLKILQATLDGIDLLFAQKIHPRRCKPQVLGLWECPPEPVESWPGVMASLGSTKA